MTAGSTEEVERGQLRIRSEDVPVRTLWIDQSRLKFFVDNPRIYSIVRAGDREPEQEEICEKLLELEHVRELKEDIKLNGGLIDPIIVRDGTFEVLEGNSRLAAYRWLYRNADPNAWTKIKCTLLPADIDERLIFALLGQYHIKGKKDWQPFEQAGFLHRRFRNHKQDIPTVASELGLRVGAAEHLIRVYEFMLERGEATPERWSFYFEYLRNSKIKKARDQYPDFDKLIVTKIRNGEIKRAVDVRDGLPMICDGPSRYLKRFCEEKIDFEEALDHARDAGGDNADLQKITKFKNWIAGTDIENDMVDNPKNIRDKIDYELGQIEKRIGKIRTRLEKAKLKEEQAVARR